MSLRRTVIIVIVAFLVFVYFVTARFPAAQGLVLLSKLSQGKLVYANASGTIWQGKAEQVLISTPQQLIDLGQTQWQLYGWPLLLAKLSVDIEAKKTGQLLKAKVLASKNQAKLDEVEVRIALQQLLAFSPMPLPITVEGSLQLDLQSVELNQSGINSISGNAVVQNTVLKMHDDIVLGSYGAKLSKENNDIVANVTDIDGTVELSGVMKANLTNRTYNHEVMLLPNADAHAMISQTLAMVAAKQSDGRYQFKQNGNF